MKNILLELLMFTFVALRTLQFYLLYKIASEVIMWINKRRDKMNIVEKLLAIDAGKIKIPEKDVKMKLQKLGEQEFVFPCKAVDPEYVAELQENSITFKKGDISKIKMYDTKVLTIIEGCPTVFKNKDLLKHFGAVTPKDLVKKLLLSGEMDELKGEIDKLGGYDKEDDDEEIKN